MMLMVDYGIDDDQMMMLVRTMTFNDDDGDAYCLW